MSENAVVGQPGELRAVIEIKRAATGKVETFEIVGRMAEDIHENSQIGGSHRGHPQHSGS